MLSLFLAEDNNAEFTLPLWAMKLFLADCYQFGLTLV